MRRNLFLINLQVYSKFFTEDCFNNLFEFSMVFGAVKKSSENYRSSHRRCSVKKIVLKNVAIFSGKHLRCSFFLTKWQAFWPATLLKETPAPTFFCEYSKLFKNTYFEVETLEKEIYSCFLMNEVMHSLLEKVKKPKLFYSMEI